jgi:hypothetical protein
MPGAVAAEGTGGEGPGGERLRPKGAGLPEKVAPTVIKHAESYLPLANGAGSPCGSAQDGDAKAFRSLRLSDAAVQAVGLSGGCR